MTVTISGTSGITNVDGSAGTPAEKGSTSSTAGVFFPAANTVAISTASTERMRVDSSGNVGIGLTSPAATFGKSGTLDANGVVITRGALNANQTDAGVFQYTGNEVSIRAYGATSGTGVIAFKTGGGGGSADTEAARIDSSGNLLVGTTSASAKLVVYAASGQVVASLIRSSTTGNDSYPTIMRDGSDNNVFFVRSDGGINATKIYNGWTTASAANMYIASDGYIYRSTSSLKYKRDVENSTHGLAEVMQLRPVTYKGKSENDGDTVFGGLIAEEVHAAGLTEFVQYAEDGSPDALAYGNMVSLCIKAIQELKAQNDELKARVAALEAK